MINEKEPLVNTYISVPKDLGGLNCASFVAGVVHGVLESGDPRNHFIFLNTFHRDLMRRG